MRLADFPMVEALVSSRDHLIGLRDEGRIRVEISGRMLAPDLIQRMVPGIKVELSAEIARIEGELVKLGVDVG